MMLSIQNVHMDLAQCGVIIQLGILYLRKKEKSYLKQKKREKKFC